ncbi:MAG TPA: efflux RND transporter periplasmic adaptor subunit [Dokdonella sp.]|uniref:HlyD family secretion protein n=1 Tax=Dokdonella sp. TaxID=2291710 RepID=UPI002D802661|nr:efflux RND transporter periplasmic adaptor subunit [Dokdonella sp.]HET9032826.1 efflux RND transporter periplasmic adaptor subunit [Dokdonella sp.]
MSENETRAEVPHGPQPAAPIDSSTRSAPTSAPRWLGAAVIVIALTVIVSGLWLAFRSPADVIQGMADADSVKVSAKITARVSKLLVREGDRVDTGQVLFELDSPEVAAKQQQANALLDAARAQAGKAEQGARTEEIRAAESNWRRAVAGAELSRSTYRRVENLYREGVMSRQKRDEALAQERSSRELASAARAQYDLALAGARTEDKAAAEAQVRQAEGAVAEVHAAQAEIDGRAPIAGELGKRLADVGELVPAGYPVFTLVDIDRMWVSLNLREDQFGGIRIGQRLPGDIPALERKAVPFEVYFISPAGDFATWRSTRQSSGYDVKSFEVRVRPLQPIKGFRPGMSVLFAWPPKD